MTRIDLLFYGIMAGLVVAALGTIALCIWVLESWWARIGLVVGASIAIVLMFYATVFWLAAKSNNMSLAQDDLGHTEQSSVPAAPDQGPQE